MDARRSRVCAARAEKIPVASHGDGGPIARGGSGGRASRRTVSGSARSIGRMPPLWYPLARDGAAAVYSMARSRLAEAGSGASETAMGVTKTKKKKPVTSQLRTFHVFSVVFLVKLSNTFSYGTVV